MSKLARLAAVAFALAVSLPTHAYAQGGNIFQRATPDAEAALRARITGFFEAQQQGKWRDAQKFVTEDSIDAYLEREKNRYATFEIHDIQWSAEYKSASVTMVVPWDMMVPGVGKVASAPRPMTEHWRLEDGTWFWYVPKIDPCAPIRTVVGVITPECKDGKPVQRADSAVDSQKVLEKMIEANTAKLADVQRRVTANVGQVELASDRAGEQNVTITNGFDGPVTLRVMGGAITGLKISFDGEAGAVPIRVVVQPKEAATLRLKFQPSEVAPPDRMGLQIQVDPLNVSLPLDVFFTRKNTPQK